MTIPAPLSAGLIIIDWSLPKSLRSVNWSWEILCLSLYFLDSNFSRSHKTSFSNTVIKGS